MNLKSLLWIINMTHDIKPKENIFKKYQFVVSVSGKHNKTNPGFEINFWRDFVMSITQSEHLVFGLTIDDIRKSNRIDKKQQHIFKTTLSGQVINTTYPKHPHQYSSAQKNGMSKPRSLSFIAPMVGFNPPVFGIDYEKKKGDKGTLVGVIFPTNAPNADPNILPSRIFWRNTGTAFRTYYHSTESESQRYFKVENVSDIPALIAKHNMTENNEILARVKWHQDALIGIFLDNEKSRIQAQMRAMDMRNITNADVGIGFYDHQIAGYNSLSNYSIDMQNIDLNKALSSQLPEVKAMALLTFCLKHTEQYENLNENLDLLPLKKHFLNLLVNGHVSYVTEKIFLEKLLYLDLSYLNPSQQAYFFKYINEKLKNNYELLDDYNDTFTQFIQFQVNEALKELKYEDSASVGYNSSDSDSEVKEQVVLNDEQDDGLTSLMRACLHSDFTIVEQLLSSGCDVNEKNDEEITAIILAMNNQDKLVVEKLFEHGAILDNSEYAYLQMQMPNEFKYFLEKYPKSFEKITILDEVSIEDLPSSRLENLEYPATEKSPLAESVNKEKEEQLDKLFNKLFKNTIDDSQRLGKLIELCTLKLYDNPLKNDLIKFVVDKYPQLLEKKDDIENTIFHHLARCEQATTLQFLIKTYHLNKIYLDKPNKVNNTPLIMAAGSGDAVMVKMLLEAGADVNHQGTNNLSALDRAASVRDPDKRAAVMQLLEDKLKSELALSTSRRRGSIR